MTIQIGNYALCLGVLMGVLVVFGALAAVKFDDARKLGIAKGALVLFAALISLASAMLMVAMVKTNYRLEYVQHYTERALPFGYKLAAFWAGQEGSLLLWAELLAVISVIAAFTHKSDSLREKGVAVAVLGGVCSFFAALMMFAANPFKLAAVVTADGHGLNPMLQDPGMIAHPPTLFMGYAAYTIPFAFLVGSLLSGKKGSDWLAASRWWAVFAWLFLTVGIVLGAQWAYVELGWGGYWAWDPVENASLLPWLTGTALLHSIIGQQQRGMFKQWNAWLIAATFILCVFGTYLTRSGVVQSVHSFGESLIGTFFLIFLATSTLASFVLILVRSRDLKTEHPLENLVSREGAFLAANILLVIVTAVTLIGTVFPLISGLFMKEGITVSQSFYNTCVAPMGLLLAGVMAFGPVLVYGKEAAGRLVRTQFVPVIAAIVVAGVVAVKVTANVWALLTAVITTIAFINIVADGIRATWLRASHHQESLAIAALRVFDNNHRRYGGQIVHTGVILLIVGVTGSSLFSHKQDLKLRPQESAMVGSYKITLKGLDEVQKPTHTAVEASLVVVSPDGKVGELVPERLFFNKSEQSNANVAIRSTWREDLYITLAGWEDGGQLVTVQALINPLVSWIWIGGIVMTVGGIVCLLPRFEPRRAVEAVVVAEKTPAVVREYQSTNENRKSLRSDKRKVRQ